MAVSNESLFEEEFNIWVSNQISFESLVKSLVDSLDEIQGVQVRGLGDVVGAVNADCQIFCHLSVFDSFNGSSLEFSTEVSQLRVVVEFGSVEKSSAPCVDAGNGVGRGFSSLLVFTIMSSDCSVSGFCFNCSIRSVQY